MVLEETKGRTVRHTPPEFTGDWSSSQLGCLRQMYLIAKGIEGDFYESAVLEEGRLHEDDIVAKMRVKGLNITDRFQELQHPGLPLKGHPDGRFVVTGSEGLSIPEGRYLLEVKSMDRSFYYKAIKNFIEFFPHLYRQLQSYSLMSEGHEPVFTPVKNRATGEIHELIFEPDQNAWREIEDWIRLLRQAILTDGYDYKQLPCPPTDSITGKYCPYRAIGMCEHQTNIPEVTETQVVQALSDYEEGKVLERQGGNLKDSAKTVIIHYLKKNNVRQIKIGDKMPMLTQGSRRSCDFDELRKQNPKLYDLVVKISEYDKFEIK